MEERAGERMSGRKKSLERLRGGQLSGHDAGEGRSSGETTRGGLGQGRPSPVRLWDGHQLILVEGDLQLGSRPALRSRGCQSIPDRHLPGQAALIAAPLLIYGHGYCQPATSPPSSSPASPSGECQSVLTRNALSQHKKYQDGIKQ